MSTFAGYGAEHEQTMRLYCTSLPEDHRRRYAALEALMIGRGRIMYVATVLSISRRTIYTGIRELAAMDPGDGSPPQRPSGDPQRARRRGGGRPKAGVRQPGVAPRAIFEGASLIRSMCPAVSTLSGTVPATWVMCFAPIPAKPLQVSHISVSSYDQIT
jgi:hypothetical protein